MGLSIKKLVCQSLKLYSVLTWILLQIYIVVAAEHGKLEAARVRLKLGADLQNARQEVLRRDRELAEYGLMQQERAEGREHVSPQKAGGRCRPLIAMPLMQGLTMQRGGVRCPRVTLADVAFVGAEALATRVSLLPSALLRRMRWLRWLRFFE